jgi:hypothetical protein
LATKTFYPLSTAGSSPNFVSTLQEGGSAPTAANSPYGWTVAKLAAGSFMRARLGATAVATVSQGTSFIDAQTKPQVGTGTAATTAGDYFLTPTPYNGTFAATAWTFNFNLRASTAGAIGRIRLRVWASPSPDGSGARVLTGSTQVGATVTLSTTADVNSSISWSPGTITLVQEYLMFEVEWNETTTGSSTSDNVFFRLGTTSFVTPNFTAATSSRILDATVGFFPATWSNTRASGAGQFYAASKMIMEQASNNSIIDYDSSGAIKGLTVFDTATNLAPYGSNVIAGVSASFWGTTNGIAALSTDGTLGPSGNQMAKVACVAGSNSKAAFPFTQWTITANTNYASTWIVKKGTNTFPKIACYDNSSNEFGAVFDISGTSDGVASETYTVAGGVLVSTSMRYLGNNFFAVTVVGNVPTAVFDTNIGPVPLATGNNFAGGWTAAGTETLYFDHVQTELGSAFTSPILQPTATLVTRAADVSTFTLDAATKALKFTFDDGSTQIVTGLTPSSTYTVPTNLNRDWIKYIDAFVVAYIPQRIKFLLRR